MVCGGGQTRPIFDNTHLWFSFGEKVFMAGLQGEAGGDVRFNSEGDAVSNLLTHMDNGKRIAPTTF